ncbi:MAG: hypothetical protein K0S53_2831 [Bacteroidetes bacterium]|jgi:hypothetical protein|nr:hypothetical protein [Bacteroidota bacterium]
MRTGSQLNQSKFGIRNPQAAQKQTAIYSFRLQILYRKNVYEVFDINKFLFFCEVKI